MTLFEIEVTNALSQDVGKRCYESGDYIHDLTFRETVCVVIKRLRAGGISDMAIRNILVTPHQSFKEITRT